MSAIDHNPGNTYANREISLAPLREAFIASGITQGEAARRLGWYRNDRPGIGDATRFARAIGLRLETCRGHRGYRQTTTYERALKIAEALNVDPVDVGL